MTVLESLAEALIAGLDDEVTTLTRRALDEGTQPRVVLDQGLLAGMAVVGGRFKRREIFLPDVLLAAKAMKAGTSLLEPLLGEGGSARGGTVVLGTVKGDLHDIGKNLAAVMIRGKGFQVIDLGKDVPPERFVDAAVEAKAGVIGMSALLTTTMPVMKQVIDLLRARGLQGQIRTLVGGAPVTAAHAAEIGADGYAADAGSAAERVASLLAPAAGGTP
jgi:5-methyltetrahydrofolate--homocysteine methyltransferase